MRCLKHSVHLAMIRRFRLAELYTRTMQDGITEANWAPTEAPAKPKVQLTNMPQNKFKLSTTESETRVRSVHLLLLGLPLSFALRVPLHSFPCSPQQLQRQTSV